MGIPNFIPAIILELPSNPPKYEYYVAENAPFGPYALLSPNSTNFLSLPTICLILLAFVATNDGKDTKFINGVSIS